MDRPVERSLQEKQKACLDFHIRILCGKEQWYPREQPRAGHCHAFKQSPSESPPQQDAHWDSPIKTTAASFQLSLGSRIKVRHKIGLSVSFRNRL